MHPDSIVTLNVGGTAFQTCLKNILKYPNSFFAKMYEEREKKESLQFFLDQDPEYFRVVLNYLRNGELLKFKDEQLYFGVRNLAKNLDFHH